MIKETSIFDEFTGKYQLSKTLRFELRPVGETSVFLEKNKIFEKDQTIDDSYNQAKFYFDELHREFINSALKLENVKNLPYETFAKIWDKCNQQLKAIKSNENYKSNYKELQKKLNELNQKIDKAKDDFYKRIKSCFNAEAKEWKDDYINKNKKNKKSSNIVGDDDNDKNTIKFLMSKESVEVLKDKFPAKNDREFQAKDWPSLFVEVKENPGHKRYIFDSFDKFFTYLSKFQQTRANLYKDDGTSTAVATRVVDNFIIFLLNQRAFREKYQSSYSQIGFNTNDRKVFETDYYKNCLLQNGIDAVNEIIGRLNQKIKEFIDKKENGNKKEFKKSDYPLFKKLDKQILGKVEKEKQLIEDINQVPLAFQKFINLNEKYFKVARELMDELFVGEFMEEYDGIYLKNTAINTISRRWFINGG